MASQPAAKAKTVAAPKTLAKKSAKAVTTTTKKPAEAAARVAEPKAAPKAARVSAPKKAAETVTLKTVFERLAEAQDMTKKQAIAMATGMVDLVTGILKAGDRVRLSGLGILEVKDRPARVGRNPATGAMVQIAASKKVAFRPSKELKAAV